MAGVAAVAVVLTTVTAADASAGQSRRATTQLVSVATNGTQGSRDSFAPRVSGNGRYVAFKSEANDLVAGDTSGEDVFIRDRRTGVTRRVSIGTRGQQPGELIGAIAISLDGRYVAFDTASALVRSDTNHLSDVYVRDVRRGITTRISVGPRGRQSNGNSFEPSLSADGRYVAFGSWGSNLVRGDTNRSSDVFVHDQQTGITGRVSIAMRGAQADDMSETPSISANGRHVAFESSATNLVAADTNDTTDVFVRDLSRGRTVRASVGPGGRQSYGGQAGYGSVDPVLSADGRSVAFDSYASGLVDGPQLNMADAYVRNLTTRVTQRVALSSDEQQGQGLGGYVSAISADGRYVVFGSFAPNFVPGDTNGTSDVFVRDVRTGRTHRVSVDASGNQAPDGGGGASMSADGRYVAFGSSSPLTPRDANAAADVFLRGPLR